MTPPSGGWAARGALALAGYAWLLSTALTLFYVARHPDVHCWPSLSEVVHAVAPTLLLAVPGALVLAVVALVRHGGPPGSRLRSLGGLAGLLALGFVVLFFVSPAPGDAIRVWYGVHTDFCECPQPEFIYFQF